MADNSMAFAEWIKRQDGEDFLRSLEETVRARLMDYEASGVAGAGLHERTGERQAYRNGYRERTLDTRLGTLDLRIPKLRSGSYFPSFLEPRRLSEKAMAAVVQEAWIGGVSTRKGDDRVQALGLTGISKSQVSALCEEIDERGARSSIGRSRANGPIWGWRPPTSRCGKADAWVSVAAIIACAVNQAGRREILGLAIGESEARPLWVRFLNSLKQRGLTGVKRVIPDALRRAEGRGRTGVLRRLAALPGAFHEELPGLCAKGEPGDGQRADPPGVRATGCGVCPSDLASGGRPVARPLPESGGADGRGGRGCAGVFHVSGGTPGETVLGQHLGAAGQGSEAPGQRRRHLPE
ncbi:MAG: transposase [Burkholderiales bacterium]|nr:transposase [Burkholderiales bacterium]